MVISLSRYEQSQQIPTATFLTERLILDWDVECLSSAVALEVHRVERDEWHGEWSRSQRSGIGVKTVLLLDVLEAGPDEAEDFERVAIR